MFAALYIADFELQSILRTEPHLFRRPVALVEGGPRKGMVFQLTSPAREAGVNEGMASTQALARCPTILIRQRSQSDETATTQILLQVAYNFSPRIEATSIGTCILDLQSLPVLLNAATREDHKDALQKWGQQIVDILLQLNLHARVGIAATPNLALHAAREASPVLFITDPERFIGALPIMRLAPSPQIAEILGRWGIRTVREFTALGKDRIAERLGPEGTELYDSASTTAIRPLNLVTPSEEFSETMEFENEVESLQPLLFALRRFVEQLANRIRLLHLSVGELRLLLKLASGEEYKTILRIPAPSSNVETLFRMLQTHLETVRTEAPVIALELHAKPIRTENFQFGLFEASLRDPNQFAETVARLSALCGEQKVGTAVPENTHRPDAFTIIPPAFDQSIPMEPPRFNEVQTGLVLRRFRPPIHADVEVRNGRLTFISSTKFSSRIQGISGPYRSSGDWWEEEKTWTRDEWDIEIADGSLFRIYHSKNDWFIEGRYD